MRKPIWLVLPGVIIGLSACVHLPSISMLPHDLSSADACGPNSALSPLTSPFPKIDRRPNSKPWPLRTVTTIPTYDPDSGQMWQIDLRSCDLSEADLTQSLKDLMYADFDSRTKWPPRDKMPHGFDWERVMELGKDPGLGIRRLHAQGFTGHGVGIAIIDQTLLVDHQEYAYQLQLYEETDDIQGPWLNTQMHGPAVASIAVGKTVGVAPGADLYYIASAMGLTATNRTADFSCLARNVRRVLEINSLLPADRRIRVISVAIGWGPESKGYDDITAAAREAVAAGMLVVCSSMEQVHGFKFHGLGRPPLADPAQFESYEPGLWWAKKFYDGGWPADRLLIPMDSRTTASPEGGDEYVFYREGGWSWCIPYIAGMYALAAEVRPMITPGEFWSLALKTGHIIELEHEGKKVPFGPILAPSALMAALRGK